MRNLKLFEEYKDKLFWKISYDELFDQVIGDDIFYSEENNWVKFNDDEIQKISQFIPKIINRHNSFLFWNSRIKKKKHSLSMPTTTSKTNYIYKLKDEWYYIFISTETTNHCYKCDQWDGLIACLEYLKEKEMI